MKDKPISKIKVECQNSIDPFCKKSFYLTPPEIERGKVNFCSDYCRKMWKDKSTHYGEKFSSIVYNWGDSPSQNRQKLRSADLGWTYGCELEWADCDRTFKIPEHLGKWSQKEFDLFNSDGTAVDPQCKRCTRGGEVNTTPSFTIKEQVEKVDELISLLNPNLTFRCYFDTHISVPGLTENLQLLKKLFTYIQNNFEFMSENIGPVVDPEKENYETPEGLKLAKKYARVQQFIKINPSREKEMLSAKTPQEFFNFHYPPAIYEKGERAWGVHKRASINLCSLIKHGTIEFRLFRGSIDANQVGRCFVLSREILLAGLTDQRPVKEIWEEGGGVEGWKVPESLPFVLWQELKFQETRKMHLTPWKPRVTKICKNEGDPSCYKYAFVLPEKVVEGKNYYCSNYCKGKLEG